MNCIYILLRHVPRLNPVLSLSRAIIKSRQRCFDSGLVATGAKLQAVVSLRQFVLGSFASTWHGAAGLERSISPHKVASAESSADFPTDPQVDGSGLSSLSCSSLVIVSRIEAPNSKPLDPGPTPGPVG